jgi:hypothetical protein
MWEILVESMPMEIYYKIEGVGLILNINQNYLKIDSLRSIEQYLMY